MITTEKFMEIWKEEPTERTHMVYNEAGISVISQTEEKANAIAEYMTRYHGIKFTVKEIN